MPNHIVNRILIISFVGFFLNLLIFSGQLTFAQSLPSVKSMVAERVLGNKNAPVEVIEYASLTCPHCASFHNGPWPTLKKEYLDTGRIKLIYRDFPTDQLAVAASMIAKCAPKSRYFGIIELMFKTQDKWRRSSNPRKALSNMGRLAGMSQATVEACMSNQAVFDGIMKQRDEGHKNFNIESTPTLIVNGKKVEGDLSLKEFRRIFDQALSDSSGK